MPAGETKEDSSMLFTQLSEVYVIISMATSHMEAVKGKEDQRFGLIEGLCMEALKKNRIKLYCLSQKG